MTGAPHGITVNALAPGWFRTEQNRAMYEDEGWVDYLVERIPLKRPGAPNDLDGAIVFLASEASRYITGQTLLIDGGISVGATRAPPETVARKQKSHSERSRGTHALCTSGEPARSERRKYPYPSLAAKVPPKHSLHHRHPSTPQLNTHYPEQVTNQDLPRDRQHLTATLRTLFPEISAIDTALSPTLGGRSAAVGRPRTHRAAGLRAQPQLPLRQRHPPLRIPAPRRPHPCRGPRCRPQRRTRARPTPASSSMSSPGEITLAAPLRPARRSHLAGSRTLQERLPAQRLCRAPTRRHSRRYHPPSPASDAFTHQLTQTGYLHNHAPHVVRRPSHPPGGASAGKPAPASSFSTSSMATPPATISPGSGSPAPSRPSPTSSTVKISSATPLAFLAAPVPTPPPTPAPSKVTTNPSPRTSSLASTLLSRTTPCPPHPHPTRKAARTGQPTHLGNPLSGSTRTASTPQSPMLYAHTRKPGRLPLGSPLAHRERHRLETRRLPRRVPARDSPHHRNAHRRSRRRAPRRRPPIRRRVTSSPSAPRTPASSPPPSPSPGTCLSSGMTHPPSSKALAPSSSKRFSRYWQRAQPSAMQPPATSPRPPVQAARSAARAQSVPAKTHTPESPRTGIPPQSQTPTIPMRRLPPCNP